jgi:hypothetical protein
MKRIVATLLTLGTLSGLNAHALEVGALGGLVKFEMNPLFDLEFHLIYAKKKNAYTDSTGTSVWEMTSHMVPVMIRSSFIPGNFVNVEAGVYYEIEASSGVTVDGANSAYSDASIKHNDIGLNEQQNDTATNGSYKNRSIQDFAGALKSVIA